MRVGLILILISSSCSGTGAVNVGGHDGDVIATELRLEVPLKSGRMSIEISVALASGDDVQSLGSGELITLGGGTIGGGAQVESDLDLSLSTVAYKLGVGDPEQESVRMAIFGGLGIASSEIVLRSGAQVLRAEDDDPYFFAGGEVIGTLSDHLQLRARIALPLLGATMPVELEVVGGLNYQALTLFAGWRYVDLEWTRSGSDVDYRLSGPVVGLHLGF